LKLEVPENRIQTSGRSIFISVAIFKANSSSKNEAPIYLLAGGPGQSATESFSNLPEAFRRLRRSHDIVLMDQRGTGESHPLRCVQESDSKWELTWNEQLSMTTTRNCVDRWRSTTDLTAYTTDAAAEDLEAVRKALGHKKIILFGVSYGTRLALRYLALHPESVEKQILEGVLSPAVNITKTDSSMKSSIKSIAALCRQDVDCQKYGDPWKHYQKLLETWSKKPKARLMDPRSGQWKDVTLRPEILDNFINMLLYSPVDMSVVPPILLAASKGDLAPLMAKAFGSNFGVYDGLQYLLICAEDYRDMGPPETPSQKLLAEVCQLLPPSTLPAEFRLQPPSAVPTLMLSGSLDPVTPPHYGQSLRSVLSNTTHIILPDYGHNISYVGCVQDVMISFIESKKPAIELPDCLKKLRTLHFFKGALPQ